MKLHSRLNRRLVSGGSRKLNDDEVFKRRVYISADEPLEERRRTTQERFKRRAARDGKEVVDRDGVLVIDNFEILFCQRWFCKVTERWLQW